MKLRRRGVSRAILDPIPQGCTIYLGDALGVNTRIDDRGDLFIRQVRGPLRPLNHALTIGCEHPEFDFRATAEALLTCAIIHFQRESKSVKPSVHRFVKNRRRDLGIRELRIHRESQLDETGTLLVEISTPAGEALNHYVREVPLEMPEMVGNVALDQSQTAIESGDDRIGLDVGPSVVDDHVDPAHLVPGHAVRFPLSGEAPE